MAVSIPSVEARGADRYASLQSPRMSKNVMIRQRPERRGYDWRMALLLDRKCLEEIRFIERAAGRDDVWTGFVRNLEGKLAEFGESFRAFVACGDTTGAARAAHSLKGACLQLGAVALGEVFADIECRAKAGDYTGAKGKFDESAGLIAQSLDALKHA